MDRSRPNQKASAPATPATARASSGMLRIPAGAFLMGSDDGSDFERPVRSVWTDGFWMDVAPVSNRQFEEFVSATGYVTTAEQKGRAWGFRAGRYGDLDGLSWRRYADSPRGDHPVVLVSWFDAKAYASWAGKRLPSEAEWEKAARGGLEQAMYPWGNQAAEASRAPFARPPAELPGTVPVGSFAPNGYGLCDMVGLVWQWCDDWYDASHYGRPEPRDSRGPEHGELRVRRGGAWNVIQAFRLRCANRGAVEPESAVPNMGFRCVRDELEKACTGSISRGA